MSRSKPDRPVSRVEFARLAGVSAMAVTKAARGKLRAACIGDRINRARQSGWEFVMKDEIALQENLVPGNNDLGTQVRKVVNPNLIPPTVAYLMKKPADLDALHQAEIQEVNNRNEAALRQGRVNAQAGDGRYVAGDVQNSLLPKIEISRNLNR